MNSWRQTMMAGLRPTLAAAQAFATTDFRPDLASFTVPTLVIHGTADKTVPIDATGRVVAAQVPGAELIEYDGSAHGLFATDKERLIADLLAFLGGSGADQRSAIPMSETTY
jgi:pimeloyl-ACP methyl ester carboxylesterase